MDLMAFMRPRWSTSPGKGAAKSEVSATFAKTFPDASIVSIKCVKGGIDKQPAM